MVDGDIEAQYNARAMVPEHPDIFARWTREAALYRAQAHAELGLSYGDSPRQTVDIFLPPGAGPAPMVLFIHGGWWRALEPGMFSHMARGLNAHGAAVAVAGYDLCPLVSIAAIIAQMRRACLFLWRRNARRILAVGHSAGGHLAAAMVATDWRATDPDAPADLVPAGYAISGVFDLMPLLSTSMNVDFRLDAESARAVSPLYWPLPERRRFEVVVGGLESNAFKQQSRALTQAWSGTRYGEIAGTNHFTVLDPLADPHSAMVARLAQICARTFS